jgi:hypothetical protein
MGLFNEKARDILVLVILDRIDKLLLAILLTLLHFGNELLVSSFSLFLPELSSVELLFSFLLFVLKYEFRHIV